MTRGRREEMKQHESLIRDWRICLVVEARVLWKDLKWCVLKKTWKARAKGIAWNFETARSVKGNFHKVNDQESRKRGRREVKIPWSWEVSDCSASLWDMSHERKLDVNESWVGCQQDGTRGVRVNSKTPKHLVDAKVGLWRTWKCIGWGWDRS